MPCACVAVIGKQNNPLFIRTFQADEEPEAADAATRLHYVVHAALDVVEERGATPPHPTPPHAACPAQLTGGAGVRAVAQKRGPQQAGLYLGLLYPTEDLGVCALAPCPPPPPVPPAGSASTRAGLTRAAAGTATSPTPRSSWWWSRTGTLSRPTTP